MTHRNVTLDSQMTRAELVEQVMDGWPQSRSGPACLRVSRSTVSKWRAAVP